MPSIKNLKNIQTNNSKKPSTGLWHMLDNFKTLIPQKIEPSDSTQNPELNPKIQKAEINSGQNRVQSGCKVGAKPGAKWVQSGCSEKQSGCKVGAQPGAHSGAKWVQSGCKVDTNHCFANVVGLQRSIVILIYNECRAIRSEKTKQLSIEYLTSSLNYSYNSIKSAVKRLIKKNIINRIDFKTGRSGWSTYSVSEHVFQELLCNEDNYKSGAKWVQSGCKVGAQPGAQPGAAVVVSSYINNKLLTTTALPEEFKALDFSCLANIGFDESHIIQIHREYTKKPELTLSTEIIQNSINAFAFDLKHNNISKDFKGSSAVVLTTLLKKGQPYSSKTPEKVLTPQEEAMQEYLLAQEKQQQKIAEIKIKARNLALQEWLDSLSTEEMLAFNQEPRPEGLPDKVYQSSRRKKALEFAKDYFYTVLWPDKLKEILNNIEESNKSQKQT